MMRRWKKWLRRSLMCSRLGCWLMIGRYNTYLDQFARVAIAADNFDLQGPSIPTSLRFRLHRCIHRLEKGLSMWPRRTGFGRENVLELFMLMRKWREVNAETHPTYLWGLDVASAYFDTLAADVAVIGLPESERQRLDLLAAELLPLWGQFTPRATSLRLKTPVRWADCPHFDELESYGRLLLARKSVRRWTSAQVPRAAIELAMAHALRAPSACNREPFGVIAIEDPETIRQAASLLSGGTGFAEKAPLLLALTSDYSAYGGHEQRGLAFIDGGLAAMAFLLSLTAQHYGTVPMNWSVEVERDRKMRRLLGLSDTQVILFFVAVGRPHPDALIPASMRRPATDTLKWIGAADSAEPVPREEPVHA